MKLSGRTFIPLLAATALASSGLTLMAARQQEEPEWSKLKAVYETINKEYVTEPDQTKLLDGALDGMMKSLDDPYSVYMSREESKGFEENISASFVGIGAEIEELEGHIVIVAPIKNSPAEKAGLKPGDRILSVGDISLEGMKVTEAVKHVRGEKGSKAELTVERPGEADVLRFTIVRDTIPVETVYSELKEDGVGYVHITKVSETTAAEFAKQVKALQDQGMKKLVLDLRQNPGGLLDVAYQIAEMMVPRGKVVLKTEDRSGKKDVYTSAGSGPYPDISGVPTVALVDEGTASAGEILAGALKESAGVKLIGQKTFGKGVAQTLIELKDGSSVKYTNSKWLTPNDTWINKTGIQPDLEVKLPEYANLPFLDPDKPLKADTFGPEVKALQQMLDALGYAPGRTDGYFDAKTEAVIRAFQTAQKLTVTGIASGETTRKIITELQALIKKNDPQLQAALEELKKK